MASTTGRLPFACPQLASTTGRLPIADNWRFAFDVESSSSLHCLRRLTETTKTTSATNKTYRHTSNGFLAFGGMGAWEPNAVGDYDWQTTNQWVIGVPLFLSCAP